jgi:WD40 repeat protein
VYVWNQAGKILSQIEVRTKVLTLAYSPSGTSLLVGTDNGQVILYDMRTPDHRSLLSIGKHGDWVWQVAFSQSGKYFLSASADNTVKVWNLAGELVLDIKQPGTVRSAAFSPPGNQLLVASWGTTGSQNNKVSFYQLDIY